MSVVRQACDHGAHYGDGAGRRTCVTCGHTWRLPDYDAAEEMP